MRLLLIAGCNTHTPSRDLSAEEIVERYKYIDVVRVKAIGNTGCDLYIVTTVQLDKVVVCPTNQSPPALTQENSPENNPDDIVEVEVIDVAPGVVGAVPEKN